jgi:hypothetical protein
MYVRKAQIVSGVVSSSKVRIPDHRYYLLSTTDRAEITVLQ